MKPPMLTQCSDPGRFVLAGRSLAQLTQCLISAGGLEGRSAVPGLRRMTGACPALLRGGLGRLLEKARKAGKPPPLILT